MLSRKKFNNDLGEPKALFVLSLLTFTALAFVMVAAHGLYRDWKCPPEILKEEPIVGTNWVAQVRNGSCSFGSAEMIDLRVIKSNGYGATVLATGYDIDLAVLDGSMRSHLRITIPQGRDINVHMAKVRGLDIEFAYKALPSTVAKPK